jgi:hypothetical protein
MNNRNKFRLLVISTNLGYVVSVLIFAFLNIGQLEAAYAALPEESSSENFLSKLISSELFALALGVIWVISVIGLLLFKNWGRTLTTLGFLVSIPCLAFTSPNIELGIESALNELLAVCYGIILASMYLQPIASEFNKALHQTNCK